MSFASELRDLSTKKNNLLPRLKEDMRKRAEAGNTDIRISFADLPQFNKGTVNDPNYDYADWVYEGGPVPWKFYDTITRFCDREKLNYEWSRPLLQLTIVWLKSEEEEEDGLVQAYREQDLELRKSGP